MRYRTSRPGRAGVSGRAGVLLLALWAVLGGLLLLPLGAVAQEEDPEAGDETYEPFDDEDGLGDEEDETSLEAIEQLLARDESTRSDLEGLGYDPGSRRDPFRSLLQARDIGGNEPRDRPKGVAGLLIDEIVVEGVFELADGPVAQVQASHEETSFLIRPGDQLWDGDVISITLEKVVFKQLVDDPTALKPFREVVKRLNP